MPSIALMITSAEPVHVPDAALVAAWRGGDERAADALVRRHAPALARHLYASGADRDEADDLVQETLFRGFQNLARWRGESLRAWLLTIGANLLRDQFRKRKRRRMVVLLDDDVADQADPHAELAGTEAEERLRLGLAELPRLQREVFLRRVHSGAPYEAIAAELGTTAGAARVHYHHAVQKLKGLMQ